MQYHRRLCWMLNRKRKNYPAPVNILTINARMFLGQTFIAKHIDLATKYSLLIITLGTKWFIWLFGVDLKSFSVEVHHVIVIL